MDINDLKFKRKKIKEDRNQALEELMEIYNEPTSSGSRQDKEEALEERESLKEIIEENRSKRKRNLLFFSFFIFLILAVAAAAGFFYFSSQQNSVNDEVLFSIEGPDKLKVGEVGEYKIKYANTGTVGLKNSRIIINQLPHGLIIQETSQEATNRTWPVGDLAPQSTGEITIKGKYIDKLETEQKIQLTYIFTPANFNAEFSKPATYNTALEAAPVEIEIISPGNVSPGQKITLEAKIKNPSDNVYESLKLEFIQPESFNLTSTDPAELKDKKLWEFPLLSARAIDKELKLEGSFANSLEIKDEADREKKFQMVLLAKGNNDQYYQINELSFNLKITDEPLIIYHIVNGSTSNKTVTLGSFLTFSVSVKNQGTQPYENLNITSIIKSEPADIIDWEKIKDENVGTISNTALGKEITWSKDQIEKLGKLDKAEEITLNYTLPIKAFSELSSFNQTEIAETSIETQSQITLTKDNIISTPIKSNLVELKISSNLAIEAKALYYFENGIQAGSGPYPPQVGEETMVHAFWAITNDLHELVEIKVSARLPEGIELANEQKLSTGEFKYDDVSREISWTINRLPEAMKEANADINLKFTPQTKDLGKLLQLLGNTTLTAKDTKTNALIVKTTNGLTSALEEDRYATGTGLVIP